MQVSIGHLDAASLVPFTTRCSALLSIMLLSCLVNVDAQSRAGRSIKEIGVIKRQAGILKNTSSPVFKFFGGAESESKLLFFITQKLGVKTCNLAVPVEIFTKKNRKNRKRTARPRKWTCRGGSEDLQSNIQAAGGRLRSDFECRRPLGGSPGQSKAFSLLGGLQWSRCGNLILHPPHNGTARYLVLQKKIWAGHHSPGSGAESPITPREYVQLHLHRRRPSNLGRLFALLRAPFFLFHSPLQYHFMPSAGLFYLYRFLVN